MELLDGMAFEKEFGVDIWKKEETPLPKYLVRPDDFMIFSLNEDNKTYTIEQHKTEFPDNLHNKYTYERLTDLGFYPIDESEIEIYDKKCLEYYKEWVASYRPDGHGGYK